MQKTSSPSSLLLLISLSLFSAQSLAQNDGMWYASSSAEEVATTSAPVIIASATTNWASVVTWPAGCETWANPCPSGAITSGVAPTAAVVTWPAGCQDWADPCPLSAIISSAPDASYTNGFTSYTTMTNSNGIITGMPPKATVAAGVSSVLSEQSAALASQTTLTTMATSASSSSSGTAITTPTFASGSFVESSPTASASAFQGGAVSNRIAGCSGAFMLAGFVFSLFL